MFTNDAHLPTRLPRLLVRSFWSFIFYLLALLLLFALFIPQMTPPALILSMSIARFWVGPVHNIAIALIIIGPIVILHHLNKRKARVYSLVPAFFLLFSLAMNIAMDGSYPLQIYTFFFTVVTLVLFDFFDGFGYLPDRSAQYIAENAALKRQNARGTKKCAHSDDKAASVRVAGPKRESSSDSRPNRAKEQQFERERTKQSFRYSPSRSQKPDLSHESQTRIDGEGVVARGDAKRLDGDDEKRSSETNQPMRMEQSYSIPSSSPIDDNAYAKRPVHGSSYYFAPIDYHLTIKDHAPKSTPSEPKKSDLAEDRASLLEMEPAQKIDEALTVEEEHIEYECPECGATVTKNITACPECGVAFDLTAYQDCGMVDDRPKEEKEEQLHCPICEASLSDTINSCPDCGVKFDELINEFEEQEQIKVEDKDMEPELVCPFCKAPISSTIGFCPACGVKFDQLLDQLEEDNAEYADAGSDLECPICCAAVTLDMTSCPKCGAEFDDLMEEIEYECPACKTTIPLDIAECPTCGLLFDGEEGTVYFCPMCEVVLPPDAMRCPECGVEFE